MGQYQKNDKGIRDLYPSEANAMKAIRVTLMQKHSFKGVMTVDQEDAIKRVFEAEARSRCADIGLVVSVQWDADCSDDPDDWNLYWNPRLIAESRVHTLDETDHDRMGWEITHGVADGQEGYIREDGTRREDPIKKDIL